MARYLISTGFHHLLYLSIRRIHIFQGEPRVKQRECWETRWQHTKIYDEHTAWLSRETIFAHCEYEKEIGATCSQLNTLHINLTTYECM